MYISLSLTIFTIPLPLINVYIFITHYIHYPITTYKCLYLYHCTSLCHSLHIYPFISPSPVLARHIIKYVTYPTNVLYRGIKFSRLVFNDVTTFVEYVLFTASTVHWEKLGFYITSTLQCIQITSITRKKTIKRL